MGNVVEEVRGRGWDALSNGTLLDRAEEAGFEVLITTEGIQHQQNMSGRKVAVVVLMSATWPLLAWKTESVRVALHGIQPGEIRRVSFVDGE